MDFCCGTTMTGRLGPLHSEGGTLLTDVPFLFCRTCGNTVLAPPFEFDITMYTHYCETDGVKSASLLDVIDKERLQEILEDYPASATEQLEPFASSEQIDHLLDLWNFAAEIDDHEWIADIKNSLLLIHKVRNDQSRLLQEQM